MLLKILNFLKLLFQTISDFFARFFTQTPPKLQKQQNKKKVTVTRRSSTRKLTRFFKQNGGSGDDTASGIQTPTTETKHELLEEELIKNGILKPEDLIAQDPKRKRLTNRLIKTPKGKKFLARITKTLAKKEAAKKTKNKAQQKKAEKAQLKKIKKIIQAAMEKLNINLSTKDQQKVIQFYKEKQNFAKTPIQAAIIALLGVISVHLTGGIQPVLQINWGNHFNIVDYNPYHGFDAGGAPIDQADRIDFSKFDPLGLEAEAVETAMQNKGFYSEFNQFIKDNGFVIDKHNKTISLKNNGNTFSL